MGYAEDLLNNEIMGNISITRQQGLVDGAYQTDFSFLNMRDADNELHGNSFTEFTVDFFPETGQIDIHDTTPYDYNPATGEPITDNVLVYSADRQLDASGWDDEYYQNAMVLAMGGLRYILESEELMGGSSVFIVPHHSGIVLSVRNGWRKKHRSTERYTAVIPVN